MAWQRRRRAVHVDGYHRKVSGPQNEPQRGRKGMIDPHFVNAQHVKIRRNQTFDKLDTERIVTAKPPIRRARFAPALKVISGPDREGRHRIVVERHKMVRSDDDQRIGSRRGQRALEMFKGGKNSISLDEGRYRAAGDLSLQCVRYTHPIQLLPFLILPSASERRAFSSSGRSLAQKHDKRKTHRRSTSPRRIFYLAKLQCKKANV